MTPDLFSAAKTNASYEYHYARLNAEQKEAVDQTEGPVMVIAGPGTGKTQILAVRIAKILTQPDVEPHNILCLTYTDAASLAMRDRLVQIIGPTAHRINIYSFHAFCNQVIQANLGYFGDFRQLEPITELEQVGLYKRLMSELPNDHILKKLKGDPNYEIRRLKHLFSTMKKENYTAAYIDEMITSYLEYLLDAEEMKYKRASGPNKKGDLKQKEYDKIERQMQELSAGAHLFDKYVSVMKSINRYDYDDMILLVARAFEASEDLLADYQERYLYFLVDEFQDTNGSQKKVVDLLLSYWQESPNVFVVGDDDQAIFKFQGANLGNIKEFRDEYKPALVVLTQNYRSSQKVLNAAMTLIEHNRERIVNDPTFPLDKNLEAKGANAALPQKVIVQTYGTIIEEQADIVHQLVETHRSGGNLNKTAILYRSHRQIEKLMAVLETHGIPVNVKKRIDVLHLPLVRNLILILRYISDQYNVKGYTDRALFELMHFNYFGISSHDISLLVWETRNQEKKDSILTPLSSLLADAKRLDQLSLTTRPNIERLNQLLDKWIADVDEVTLQVLFQNVINEGKVLEHVLKKADKSWQLQVIGTLFDLIKEETAKRPELKLHDFIQIIDQMIDNGLPLMINKILHSENGVNFMTSHSSKGLEFDQVIVIGATKDAWDKKTNKMGQYAFPKGTNGDSDDNTEDERRLMYVAMTRAEKSLVLSYSLMKENGGGLGPSQFIDEVRKSSDVEVITKNVDPEIVIDFQARVLSQQEQKNELIDKDLVDRRLQGYKLSVTELNKYLKCPVTFYFESMLKVPMARTKYMGFGNAIHYALEMAFQNIADEGSTTATKMIEYFKMGMHRHKSHFTTEEYDDLTAYGDKVLNAYYTEYLTHLPEVKEYRLEEKIDNVEYNGIPLKGVLDRVTVLKDHVVVTDYKTANPSSPENRKKIKAPEAKYPEGGEYWRQIVFYKILCEADKKNGWNMTRGVMDFVEPDKKTGVFTKQEYVVTPDQIEMVDKQIQKAWKGIHNYEFEEGCGEPDCHWCDFLTRLEA